MQQKQNNANGFSVVEILLVLIFLALIGSIGYYIWHTQFDHTTTAETTTSTSQNKPNSSTEKYLTIKEWAVRLPLSSGDLGAYYVFNGTSGLTQTVSIFDTTVDAFKNRNGVSCKDAKYPLFVVSRIKPSDVAATQDINNPNYIGDTGPNSFQTFSFTSEYEFAGESPHQAAPQCEDLNPSGNFEDDPTVAAVYHAADQALGTSFSMMQSE